MEQKFIMTAFGTDRPGLVADVTQIIYEHGCNLEDSTMTRLEDEFAMILLCAGQGDQLGEQLSRACRRLEREKGISVFIRTIAPHETAQKRSFSTRSLHVEGVDHAGIVYRVSRYLANHRISIADLESRLHFSPGSGTGIYSIEMHVEIPEGVGMDALQTGLVQLGDELHVDITL